MWTRDNRVDGTALRWQSGGKDPSKENSVSNISLRTTWAARTKCMASLSWSQAFLRAGPMSFWNAKRTSLPSELSLRSGSAESSLSFSLVVWIRFFTVTPNCSSLALYSWAMSVSLKVGAMSSSLCMSSINATSSPKAMPCRRSSSPPSSSCAVCLALLYREPRQLIWYLARIAIMLPAASFANKSVSSSSWACNLTFLSIWCVDAACKPAEPAGSSQKKHVGSLDFVWLWTDRVWTVCVLVCCPGVASPRLYWSNIFLLTFSRHFLCHWALCALKVASTPSLSFNLFRFKPIGMCWRSWNRRRSSAKEV